MHAHAGRVAARVHAVEPSVDVIDYQPGGSARPGAIEVLHVPLAVPAVPGRLDAANGRYVLDILDRAIAGCKSGEFAGMVTADNSSHSHLVKRTP